MDLDFLIIIYWFLSFIFVDSLLELLLPLVFKSKRSSRLRKLDFRIEIILVAIFLILSLVIIIYKWQSITCVQVLASLLCSLLCAFLKERDPTDADINNCQKDTESIGAFWVYQAYDAYYKIIFQDIKDRMAAYEKDHNLEFLVKKLLLIIPLSCDVSNVFSDKDPNIKEHGILPIIECDQGANPNRKYKNPVLEISLGKSSIYVAAEYPSPLNTLWKLQNILEKEVFKYHRDCFIKTLKVVLKDSPCYVIVYDDAVEKEPLGSFLYKQVTLRRKEAIISID